MRRTVVGIGLVSAVVCALLCVVTAPPASATPVTDEGTFRDAFANDATVDLQGPISLTCGNSNPALRSINSDVTINGNGFTITQTCPNSAVLENDGSGVLNLNNVTVTGGSSGGVLSAGGVTLDHTTITGNTGGGSIESEGGFVNLFNSTITNGAYAIETGGSVFLGQSTIAFNTVPQNVGFESVVSSSSSVTLNNSTVSNNTAFGGAIYGQSVSLTFSTVVENTTTSGCITPTARLSTQSCVQEGANVNTGFSSTLTSKASVVALPQNGPNCSLDTPPPANSLGYNYSDDSSCGLTQTGDVQNGANPQLGALANNGGPTMTRLPGSGSPLIDHVPTNVCAPQIAGAGFRPIPAVQQVVDQRGVQRPQGSACDTGAVEVQPSQQGPSSTITIEALPAIAVEGGADGGFVLHRAGSTAGAITVNLQVNGTATPGSDYTAIGNVTMPAGQSSMLVPVHALQDNIADDGETVIAQVVGGLNYSVGTPNTDTVTIREHGFCDSAPQAPYTDRELFDVHAASIDCITAYGMAKGFDDGSYGPTLPVSRAQMASFVARLMKDAGVALPTNPPDAFPGDDGDVHELAINQLAALGVLDGTTGQTGDRYNVSDPMKREDMAQILFNAYLVIVGESLPPGPDAFTDDSSSDNQAAINSLAQVGVVEGTGGGLYDPTGSVSRAQMASFFVRYMQLLVGAGKLAPLP